MQWQGSLGGESAVVTTKNSKISMFLNSMIIRRAYNQIDEEDTVNEQQVCIILTHSLYGAG